jgi:hypothetical protein
MGRRVVFFETIISSPRGFSLVLPGRLSRFARHVFIAVLALSLFACAELRIRAGTRPDIAVLEQRLVLGQSSESDVAKALGQPAGRGRSLLPFKQAPRDMWSYYYEEGTLQDDRRTFLFVFFDKGYYDGYMWFSSLPQLEGRMDRT